MNMEKHPYRVRGFKAAGGACGLKKNGAHDLALIFSEREAAAAGVFTTNRVQAAPVALSREGVRRGRARAILANSGNANACTGPAGMRDARAMAQLAARSLGVEPEGVLVASTGVIGAPLDMGALETGIPRLAEGLSPDGLREAASAIMTTDRFPKLSVHEGTAAGVAYRIVGVAKGAGMIMPNMATMLCFVVSDIRIGAEPLQETLSAAVRSTFNRITVDGDTSTNDMVLVLANGAAENPEPRGEDLAAFEQGLVRVMGDLARMIVRDGEGATKLVRLEVRGATSAAEAERAARTVANSALVKTAFYGGDPNWGRIMGALGRADIDMDESLVDIWVQDVQIVSRGMGMGRDAEREAALKMAGEEFGVTIHLNMGGFQDRIYTCDLTHDYVSINADYRT